MNNDPFFTHTLTRAEQRLVLELARLALSHQDIVDAIDSHYLSSYPCGHSQDYQSPLPPLKNKLARHLGQSPLYVLCFSYLFGCSPDEETYHGNDE